MSTVTSSMVVIDSMLYDGEQTAEKLICRKLSMEREIKLNMEFEFST